MAAELHFILFAIWSTEISFHKIFSLWFIYKYSVNTIKTIQIQVLNF